MTQEVSGMQSFWYMVTLFLIVLGFFSPIAWVGAFVAWVIAVGCRPPGRRADGKPSNGGLLGGLVDSTVVAAKMRDCAYCREKVYRDATRCPHCRSDLAVDPEDCPYCRLTMPGNASECLHCGAVLEGLAREKG